MTIFVRQRSTESLSCHSGQIRDASDDRVCALLNRQHAHANRPALAPIQHGILRSYGDFCLWGALENF
jgi:hypothetical protein